MRCAKKEENMYARIAGIDLTPPILRNFIEPDGGLVILCEVIAGIQDESKLKKLLRLKDTTQHVKWEDKNERVHDATMTILGTDVSSRKGPDGQKITTYAYTLTLI
jgi:hypothetical protein